jgi:hypothetical protein
VACRPLREGDRLRVLGIKMLWEIHEPRMDYGDGENYINKHFRTRQGSLSLVSTTEELLERKRTGSCPEIREYGSRDPSR